MSLSLSGKSAVVTGGSRGIGAAIARRFAELGCDVVIAYKSNTDAAEAVVKDMSAGGGVALALQYDGCDPGAAGGFMAKAAEALGGAIDILVHSAGVVDFATIEQGDFAFYRRIFDINVDAIYAGTHAAMPRMNDGGRVIIIGSVNSHAMPGEGGSVYGASKAALTGFVRGWARDLGGRRILVNAIQPGPVDTDMNPADGPMAATLTPMTALNRYGRAEEIACVAAFVASDEASYITGTTIDVDGGMSI